MATRVCGHSVSTSQATGVCASWDKHLRAPPQYFTDITGTGMRKYTVFNNIVDITTPQRHPVIWMRGCAQRFVPAERGIWLYLACEDADLAIDRLRAQYLRIEWSCWQEPSLSEWIWTSWGKPIRTPLQYDYLSDYRLSTPSNRPWASYLKCLWCVNRNWHIILEMIIVRKSSLTHYLEIFIMRKSPLRIIWVTVIARKSSLIHYLGNGYDA